MGTETSKIAFNAHVHLRTTNQQMSRPELMWTTSLTTSLTSGPRPLGSSSRLPKVPNDDDDDDVDDDTL